MQKKIISLAIAAAFAAPVLAMADSGNVVVYGQANMSYDVLSTGTPKMGGAAGVNNNRVSSNSSRIGVKGAEDLGSGLSAIWQVESQVNLDGSGATSKSESMTTCDPIASTPATPSCTTKTTTTTSNDNTIGTRNTYVGLSSATLGTLMLGRIDTPYKTSTRKLDVFGDTIADNRSLMGGSENKVGMGSDTQFDQRAKDTVLYNSPSFNGFSGSVDVNHGNAAAETNLVAADKKYTAYSLSGQYDVAPFYATVAYESHKEDQTGVVASEKASKLGLAYTVDAFSVALVAEKTTGVGEFVAFDHTAYYLAGKFNITSSDAIKAAYTHVGALGKPSVAETGAKQYSFGYDHMMSKRTTVYALLTSLKNDNMASFALSTAATSGGANSLNAGSGGSNPHVISFGVKHAF